MHLHTTIRSALQLLAIAGFMQAAGSLAQTSEMGSFDRVVGRVSVTAPGGAIRQPNRGDSVSEGEVVTTEDDGEAGITARDGTRLTLRPKSRLEISEYRFEQATNSGSFISKLLKGSLRTISGLIGKTQPRNVTLVTPTATVGIRGTDFEVAVVETDENDTRAGTYDHVFDGATVLQVATGETLDVPIDKTGLALANPRPGEPRLQLLDSRPAFIRGGGFDALQLLQTRPVIVRPLR